jgi:hypothetical protein
MNWKKCGQKWSLTNVRYYVWKDHKDHKYPQQAKPVSSKDLNPKTSDNESAELATRPRFSMEVDDKWILKKGCGRVGDESPKTGVTGLGGESWPKQ